MSEEKIEEIKKAVEILKVEDKKKTTKLDCPICCGNKIEENFLECPYCHFQSCLTCNEKVILDNITPKCMSCKKDWSNEFVLSTFSKAFIFKKYKKHKENILYDLEKAILPTTQRKLANQRRSEEEIDKLYDEIHKIERDILGPLKNRIQILRANPNLVEDMENEEFKRASELDVINLVGIAEEKERAFFNKPCPADDCRGYLSSKYKCGMCDLKLCAMCHEIIEQPSKKYKQEEHKCDPNNVESVKALRKECRPCPKCSATIFKISGCDQMFCTICNTAFSWKTGQMHTGNIHNPHYWEYLQKNGLDQDEINRQYNNGGGRPIIPNNGCVDWNTIGTRIYPGGLDNDLFIIIREINHLEQVEQPNFRIDDLHIRNEDLRIKFLEKKINEEEFKIMLQRREKRNNYHIEVNQLLDMFINVVKDLIIDRTRNLTLVQKQDPTRRWNHVRSYYENVLTIDIKKQIDNVYRYFKTNINSVAERYSYKCPRLQIWGWEEKFLMDENFINKHNIYKN